MVHQLLWFCDGQRKTGRKTYGGNWHSSFRGKVFFSYFCLWLAIVPQLLRITLIFVSGFLLVWMFSSVSFGDLSKY